MKFRDYGIRTKALTAGFLPVLLLVMLSAVTWRSMRSMSESVSMKDQTYRIIQQAQTIERRAIDMETGLHGYLLTGKDEFLEPYLAAEKTILNDIAHVRKQLSSPSLRDLLDQIERILKQWKTTVADPEIALRQSVREGKDMNHLAVLVAEGSGKKSFDELHLMISDFVKNEEAFLAKGVNREDEPASKDTSSKTMFLVIDGNERIKDALRLGTAALEIEEGLRGYLLTGKEEFLESHTVGRTRFYQKINWLKNRVIDNSDQTRLLGQIEDGMKVWLTKVAEPQIALRSEIARSKTMMDVNRAVSQDGGKTLFNQLRRVMDTFENEEIKLLEMRTKAAQETEANTNRILFFGTALTIVAAVFIMFMLTGAIARPLLIAMRLAERIRDGDLTKSMRVRSHDEVGRLCSALNGMVDSLRKQAQNTLDVVHVLTAAASEISATSAQLSASTSKTSSAVTQTSVTVEQVKQSAKVSNEQAKNVSQAAQAVVHVSEGGRKATTDTTNRMTLIKRQMESIGETVGRLSESGNQIAEIIAAVQDLADQSNLLAVNASIEAARAGDQGKGFSVVAQEIKSLADQSRAATEQVRAILEETRRWVSAVVMATEQGAKAVDAGVTESSEAERAIQVLADNVAESAQAAQVIEASSDQQLVGVDQVGQAMANIERAMRQNVGGTIQLEASARKLAEAGLQLRELMDRYRI